MDTVVCRAGAWAGRGIGVRAGVLVALASLGACSQRAGVPAGQVGASQQGLEVGAPRTVFVVLKEQANLAPAKDIKQWGVRGDFVVNQLQAHADKHQAGVRSFLDQKGLSYQPFWIINALKVTADGDTVAALKLRNDVAEVVAERTYDIPQPIAAPDQLHVESVEWGLTNIRAPLAWSTFGLKGEGIVVASVDTGVQFDHPALVKQYRGRKNDGTFDHNYNWYDPSSICANNIPCDNNSHGTHTMGTMVGDDGDPGANQIGVAPHAKWIAAKGCESSSCSLSALLAAGQWLLAPTDLNGKNPDSSKRPNVINNSWGGGTSDTFYQATVSAWVAAGIFPAFANGNTPGAAACSTATDPGDYSQSYAVGAYDINNAIAYFSARGPSFFGGIIKPDIAAPGVNVRSSVPNNTYASYSGTSMATPHLAGAVALLWSAAPALVGDVATTESLLNGHAVATSDLSCGGTAGFNNVFGHGRLDIYATIDAAPRGATGTLSGTVTAGGAAVAGASISAVGSTTRAATSDVNGKYSVVLPVGTYNVTAIAFGAASKSVSGVSITKGAVTTQDFALAAAPTHTLSGTLTDTASNPVVSATVTLVGTPLPAATTDVNGAYTIANVPEGTYSLQANAGPCYQAQQQSITVIDDLTVDFTVPFRVDGYGYHCENGSYAFIDGTDVLPLTGVLQWTAVKLPFPFNFYGTDYATAYVTTNGDLNFLGPDTNYFNVPIPNRGLPNAAIYPYWTLLTVDYQSSIRTATLGVAPNRQFVIEWRNTPFYFTPADRVRFEVVLGENGQILFQYADVEGDSNKKGAAATVGIENETGTVGLQLSYDQPTLSNQQAVLFKTPPSGFVAGTVTDNNDGKPVVGALVRALQSGTQVRAAITDSTGAYRLLVPVGSYTVEVSLTNYVTQTLDQAVGDGDYILDDFALDTPQIVTTPGFIDLFVPVGQTRTRTLTISNGGNVALNWKGLKTGGVIGVSSTFGLVQDPKADPQALTTQNLYLNGPPTGWAPSAPGKVLQSFPLPGVNYPFGVGVETNIWFGDATYGVKDKNYEFTRAGVATGRTVDTSWATDWPADMAYDTTHKLMCQVNTNGDHGIYCFDLATGTVKEKITGAFPWTVNYERGLAYRADDDSFYIGGWVSRTIFHIKGLGARDRGALIDKRQPSDGNISGLSYNGAAGVLWEATNSYSDTIYKLDPKTCSVLATLPHPAPGYSGGGLEINGEGNLWMVSTSQRRAYLVESGVPNYTDVPWLKVAPASGTVDPSGSTDLTLTFDATGLKPGVYVTAIYLMSNAGREPQKVIPVTMTAPAYMQGLIAGGGQYFDGNGDPWDADQAYVAGSFGYLRDRGVVTTDQAISGAGDSSLFQYQRLDPYAYKFDNLYNGVYQMELNFAEFDPNRDFGTRLFDVIIRDQLVLPAMDITYEVGNLVQDPHSFLVPVNDNKIDVRFIPRLGFDPPVINSVRVTHRPDRN